MSTVTVARSLPRIAEAVGLAVRTAGAVPRQLGLTRAALEANGFTGKLGETLVVPSREGTTLVAVGVGDDPSANQLRDAAAAFARAAGNREHLATNLLEAASGSVGDAAAAVVEGVVLASYRYVGQKTDTSAASKLDTLTLVAPAASASAAERGVTRAMATTRAAQLARDLANSPPSHLNARGIADLAVELAAEHGLGCEVFGKDQLAVLGCGGILGVNAGSVEPPRMVKLTYRPRNPKAHLALVGKGVMYDSGGISLKPSNPMHAVMKMDMSGAAAVLAAMTALKALRCRNQVTAWLMCTDNMPSGSALKLGDVLTMRNGKTVEIHNTDAEGRLILADGLSLAVEEEPDAIVDIATLTGAALSALGKEYAAVLGTSDAVIEQVEAAAGAVDEPVWELPLSKDRYRKLLDSVVADMRNVGGPYAGAITAAIFLSEFSGEVPWAHIDMAGAMDVDADKGWKSKGATGYGARLLIELAQGFTPPT
ncbi:MAG: leucyl aminopeptidase [Ilumatobacter sp.]|uniref:leucyl aminopeptidase n=1 Tax=Ilumatobacter sp. TaxID=1967498 RepID=UPI00260B3180|nr:leucyl aminopeptidase [Ilumatobacter sp.]MDJ0768501.1 leucyl aminopeptidase [Ilumatobacter sp.]